MVNLCINATNNYSTSHEISSFNLLLVCIIHGINIIINCSLIACLIIITYMLDLIGKLDEHCHTCAKVYYNT